MSIAIFGDVHGRADLLSQLISEIQKGYGESIPLYSTGDLIDRGPDAKGVVDLCIKYNVQGVLGNHDLWMHKFLTLREFDTFALHPAMQGDKTLLSYGVNSRNPSEIEDQLQVPEEHKAFFLSLPIWRKVVVGGKTYRITHAGLKMLDAHAAMQGQNPKTVDEVFDLVARNTPAVVLWVGTNWRNPNLFTKDDGVQVFGHTPVFEPIISKTFVALDTGCGTKPPYALSAVILPEKRVISVTELSGRFSTGSFADFTI